MSAPVQHNAPEMVTIEINGRPVSVAKGAMIIHAADQIGIPIPRFCYHDKLSIAANCRMCLVEVEKAPKPAPACATPVADGMKVFTQSERALSAQRNVMEFLLINHPLDCPVCDQGGECELQDLSMGYGRSVSRFVERKRTVADENLGPLVGTEMTRCIHCTRCVRFMDEVAGTRELGVMDRGEFAVIGTYIGRELESELSGNIIDLCPVGALTDKVYRFRARAWELIARESVGYHDALGSNIWLHTRRNEILRTVPRDNEAVNECWVSDRDRYSFQGLYADDRATSPQVKRDGTWHDCDWDEAIEAASAALAKARGTDLGILVHPAASNEEGVLLNYLAQALQTPHIDHRLRQIDFADDASARVFETPMAAIADAPVAVLLGCNPRSEIPLLHARLQAGVRGGMRVHALTSVALDSTYPLASHTVLAPTQLLDAVLGLARCAVDAGHAAPSGLAAAVAAVDVDDAMRALFDDLKASPGAVFLLGESISGHAQASLLRAASRFVAAAVSATCNEVPQGANAIGLGRAQVLPGRDGLNARAMLESPRKAYILYGCEAPLDLADGALAGTALGAADTVIAIGGYASEQVRALADIILPIALLPESDATLTNLDGIEQVTRAGGKAPGEARAGWMVLRALGHAVDAEKFPFTSLAQVRALPMPAARGEAAAKLAERPTDVVSGQALQRIATTAIYRADAVLRRATALNASALNRGARLVINPADAKRLALSDGGQVRVGEQVLKLEISSRVPAGGAWAEAGYDETASLPVNGASILIEKA